MVSARKKMLIVVLLLIVVSVVVGAVLYKMKKSNKMVSFAKPAEVVSAPVAPVKEEEVEEEEEVEKATDVYIAPSRSIGVSTRDGRIKSVDIRGTPPVKIHENGPIWNLSPNNLPLQDQPNKFFG